MDSVEQAYCEYLLADYTSDEEELRLLFDEIQNCSEHAQNNQELKSLFQNPLFLKIMFDIFNDNEKDVKEAFYAGWNAHQQHLSKKG